MKRKKELIISIVVIVVLVLAIVGVSFAAFNYSRTGEKVNTITTGAISMTYTETSNVINIDGALPTTDATGMVRLKEGEYFDFSISSTIQGTVNINYEISAKDITVLEGDEQKIDGSHIKLYLTKLNGSEEETLMSPKTYKEETSANDYTGRPSGEMSLYQSNMTSSETNNYRLRMYVDEDYNPQGDGGGLVFAVQVNVYGKDGLSVEDRMMRVAGSEDFHSSEYKSKVTSIVTKGDTVVPDSVIESWDLSEKQNGSVIAYIEDDGMGTQTYRVTIGGEGSIVANYDMSSYFAFFDNLSQLDLTYLDTALTNNMTAMFAGSTNLTELDLSNFDTKNVTNMTMMFAGNILSATPTMSLEKITFGNNFNTSNVTDMTMMFCYCSNLTELNLNGFDTSRVNGMSQMFARCSSLTELDLTSFNTSQVTNMSQMFLGTTSLAEIRVSNLWDMSSVTNTSGMFDQSNVNEVTVV